jgi:succinate dehydrogenase/fumarate reductase flavoprotein subunit
VLQAEVLVVGGGLAGCLAAIRAKSCGADVLVVEKAHVAASGQAASGIDHLWGFFPPAHGRIGWTIDDLVEDHMQGVAHGFAFRELLELVARDAYARVLDLERMGVKFRYEDSKTPGGFRLVHQFHSLPTSLNLEGADIKRKLDAQLRRLGVRTLNRVMITDLVTEGGRIAGAVGLGTRDGEVRLFRAKALILAAGGKTGRLGRETTGSVRFNLHLPGNLSADGKAMALRAGVGVLNMEFLGARRYGLANFETAGRPPRNTWQPAASIVDTRGNVVVQKTSFFRWDDLPDGYRVDAEAVRRHWLEGGTIQPPGMPGATDFATSGPFFVDCTGAPEDEVRYVEWALGHEGKCAQLLRHLEEEGIDLRRDRLELGLGSREIGNLGASGLRVDLDMETSLPGLFAVGDEIGGLPFGASSAAFVTGWRAGEVAAARASRGPLPTLPREAEAPLRAFCEEALASRDGFTWQEVEDTLQNAIDFYCGDVRTGSMLARGLERLAMLREAPLRASSPHELARCLEVLSLLDCAEMTLEASLAREETRSKPCGFRRVDFPHQDDENWFAFSVAALEKGRIRISRAPLKGPGAGLT